MTYVAEIEFKRELRANGCCCCNAYCWANFMLTIGLIFNILAIVWDSFAVAIMYEPFGTFEGQCYVGDQVDPEDCDFKQVLLDNGYTKEVAVFILVVQCIVFLINLMGYVGLHKWYESLSLHLES